MTQYRQIPVIRPLQKTSAAANQNSVAKSYNILINVTWKILKYMLHLKVISFIIQLRRGASYVVDVAQLCSWYRKQNLEWNDNNPKIYLELYNRQFISQGLFNYRYLTKRIKEYHSSMSILQNERNGRSTIERHAEGIYYSELLWSNESFHKYGTNLKSN